MTGSALFYECIITFVPIKCSTRVCRMCTYTNDRITYLEILQLLLRLPSLHMGPCSHNARPSFRRFHSTQCYETMCYLSYTEPHQRQTSHKYVCGTSFHELVTIVVSDEYKRIILKVYFLCYSKHLFKTSDVGPRHTRTTIILCVQITSSRILLYIKLIIEY